MCGIAGIISAATGGNENDTRALLQKQLHQMGIAIAHRGPEGEGTWINNNLKAGLAHRRLSIIDLSAAGAQPMLYRERYTIIHNGEIYNYIELKETLSGKGY